MDKRARIIELNDQLRTTFKGGRVQMTRGVYDLDDRLRGRALSVHGAIQQVRRCQRARLRRLYLCRLRVRVAY